MPSLKRRHFLQLFGSTLATVGLSQANFFSQADRFGRVLAQTTPRKLALLVGINAYPDPVRDLYGCVNDVALQYHLLVHRFRFNPADIVTLADTQTDPTLTPNRENILRAFQEHLIAQARPGDVVVFHYSGHGGRIVDPNPIRIEACGTNQSPGLNGTLVPNDLVDMNQAGSEIVVSDIMGRTLFLLSHALQTENVTMVLDSCYAGAGTRGNVTVRSVGDSRLARSGVSLVASQEELAFQEQLMADYGWSLDDFQQRRSQGIAKGVALGSASCNQEAVDAVFGNFNAGAFSYMLTRYLWQLPAAQEFTTVQANLRRSTYAEADLRGFEQEPVMEVKPGSENDRQSFYFLPEWGTPAADGVITDVAADGTVEFWLGGTAAQTLSDADTIFAVWDQRGQAIAGADGEAIAIQKSGITGNPLVGRGTVISGDPSSLQPGMFLRERIVGLPANPELVVGLDPSLDDESDAAIAALTSVLQTTDADGQSVSRLRPVTMDQQTSVDCILARMNDDLRQRVTPSTQADLPGNEAYGLFTPALAFISRTDGSSNEAVTAAVNRLIPRFQTLLAAKVLRAIANTTSDLQISGEVFSANRTSGPRLPITTRTDSAGSRDSAIVQSFTDGDVMQLEIRNDESTALYTSCLLVNSRGEVDVLHPARWDAPEEAARVAAGERLVIPRQQDDVVVTLRGSGFLELITLVSTEPLRNALQGLQTIARGRGQSRGSVRASDGDPLSLIDDILGDVDRASRSGEAEFEISSRSRTVSTRAIAAFTTLLEVRS
ncbi:caspase family protein [Vacuolonema iberomarrocanum]|uniref:caspase family protein n=1 Tax=Vacuolonema iberomarrocanum TaxID=3454632 RepID=UPI0019DCD6BF|nr:caspase family protein [filamentous cyanobacterium LEGE 07170]